MGVPLCAFRKIMYKYINKCCKVLLNFIKDEMRHSSLIGICRLSQSTRPLNSMRSYNKLNRQKVYGKCTSVEYPFANLVFPIVTINFTCRIHFSAANNCWLLAGKATVVACQS